MLCTERRFASTPRSRRGGRSSCFARISSQWAGMITNRTLATMIVPSIAPTWMKAPRPLKSSPAPQAASAVSADDRDADHEVAR